MYAGHTIWRAITCCLAAVVLVPSPHSELGTIIPLRVCADPNNLPFSNDRREGFENRIAELLAHDMGTTVQFSWRPQMRGFVRKGLKAGACDVYMGVPAGYGPLLTTQPYYRSTYVIVYRTRSRVHVRSLDDSALHSLKVGVHMIGDDYQNTPPAQALAARGIVNNVRGYPIVGDLSKPDPQAEILRALERGEIDVAIVWGPFAGYFAKRSPAPLTIVPVTPARDRYGQTFAFDIAMGVARGDTALAHTLDTLLVRERPAIHRILSDYGVPLDSAQHMSGR
ncbi:MAG TPA: quinoprotein dehydrogenase-associated putative ABC transporter substrate-binding protein [Gemmatimonadaceae bacterium]|nr:quinoprotein dehydrogenase-associated putative ABC transporter substrate-binding protein [Gemmatimonadaceae bacterium]